MSSVATITIDRPQRRNALDLETCASLRDSLAAARKQEARAVVLTGAGPHFCAGADLELVHGGELAVALRDLFAEIAAFPAPVIAAVHGAALGAGTQLCLACDLRVVAPTARFGIPAAKLGLMVDHWTVERLAVLAGNGAARAMLLAGEVLDAEEALHTGLAQRSGDLDAARAWAEEIARLAPLSVAGHKLLFNELEFGRQAGAGGADEAYRRAWGSADAREGIAAFRQRRPPEFTGS